MVTSKARNNRNRRNKRKWKQQQWNKNVSSSMGIVNNHKNTNCIFSVHQTQDCWAHAPPRPYQMSKQAGSGHFHSAQCTHKRPNFVGPKNDRDNQFLLPHDVEILRGLLFMWSGRASQVIQWNSHRGN